MALVRGWRWGRALFALLIAGLLGNTACFSDSLPMAPDSGLPNFGRAAFRLTIDVNTGQITVSSPNQNTSGGGASFSLVGDEAIALHTTNCEWTAAANNRLRRCTFDLAIENLLSSVDLVTPENFPEPPLGTEGILVFPFTAAGVGVSRSDATPTSDWDNPPSNFFNDVASCGGKSSDCYRSETYPSPLPGGETSDYRTVGFDVARDAQSVAVYVVVAADLRQGTPEVPPGRESEIALGFSTTVGATLQFNGNNPGPDFTGSFVFVNDPTGSAIVLTSSDGSGDSKGLQGVISGTFNIGPISTAGGVQTAPVTGTGSVIIGDGSGGFLQAAIEWRSIQTTGSTGGLNTQGLVSLSDISYSGNAIEDFTAFAASGGDGIANMSFVFATARSLTQLTEDVTATNALAFTGALTRLAATSGGP